MAALFTCTTFLAALLLFSVQPLVARLMLPSLGGSPAVWNTAMVFFQAVLLGGYLYSHQLSKYFARYRKVALAVHGAVLLLPLLFIPIALPQNVSPPATAMPVLWLLSLLSLCVGVPFFVVSTSSPLLQRLFALTNHRDAKDPYFLYAASNAGSLIALLAYPTLIEPYLPLSTQTRLWAGLYALMVLCLWTCLAVANSAPNQSNSGADATTAPAIPWKRRGRWILLAFVPSSLMLSVTTYLSSEVVAIPLMWVLPLALYLLSFMVVFAKRQPVPLKVWARALAMLVLLLVVIFAGKARDPLSLMVSIHLLVFFVAAVVCHGELARDRPPASQLTEFYGWMALGGVLGGGFNALVAPLVFRDVTEYALTIILLCLLLPRDLLVNAQDEADAPRRFTHWDLLLPLGIGVLCFALTRVPRIAGLGYINLAISLGVPALLCYPLSRRPLRFGLAVAAILIATTLSTMNSRGGVIATERSFFGIHRVSSLGKGEFHQLAHGATLHGAQRITGNPREPLTYYSRRGPVGDIYRSAKARNLSGLKVAAIGLGAGTLAAYIERGQNWTFYEIDPLVADIARNPKFFTYWSGAPVTPKLELGDARLRIKEARDREYNLIILDAYSSDTIPVHLITREAVDLYARKLNPSGGMIAWHISNNHFDLEPIIGQLAKEKGWPALTRRDYGISPEERSQFIMPSQWVVMAPQAATLNALQADPNWRGLRTNAPIWTDDYSSLWSVLWRPKELKKVPEKR